MSSTFSSESLVLLVMLGTWLGRVWQTFRWDQWPSLLSIFIQVGLHKIPSPLKSSGDLSKGMQLPRMTGMRTQFLRSQGCLFACPVKDGGVAGEQRATRMTCPGLQLTSPHVADDLEDHVTGLTHTPPPSFVSFPDTVTPALCFPLSCHAPICICHNIQHIGKCSG